MNMNTECEEKKKNINNKRRNSPDVNVKASKRTKMDFWVSPIEISNMGASCYINSALQSLLSVPSFVAHIKTETRQDGQVKKKLRELVVGQAASFDWTFSRRTEQDPGEFIHFLLSLLDAEDVGEERS